MALSWPLDLTSTRPLSTAPPSVRLHLLTRRHHLPTISLTALSISQPSLPNKSHPFITTPTKPHDQQLKITAAHFNISFQLLISPHDHWGIWTSLFTASAFGLWPEKTKVRSTPSGALVTTLVALATTNLSIIASEVPVYSVVLEYLLPITVTCCSSEQICVASCSPSGRYFWSSCLIRLLMQVLKSGYVKVEKLMNVERYSHVMHISSMETSKNILEIGYPRDDTGYENSPQSEYIDLPRYKRATRVFAATITHQQL